VKEVVNQVVLYGQAKKLSKLQKKLWPNFPIMLGDINILNKGHGIKEVKELKYFHFFDFCTLWFLLLCFVRIINDNNFILFYRVFALPIVSCSSFRFCIDVDSTSSPMTTKPSNFSNFIAFPF